MGMYTRAPPLQGRRRRRRYPVYAESESDLEDLYPEWVNERERAIEREREAALTVGAGTSSLPAPLFSAPIRSGAKRIVLCGPPGSGKGTVSPALIAAYGMVHIAPGDMLRENVQNNTPLGRKHLYSFSVCVSLGISSPCTVSPHASAFMESGDLVPDDIIIQMVLDRLDRPDVAMHGFILDGFPRNVSQAHCLLDAGIVPTHVLVLEIPEPEVVRRLGGRLVDPQTGDTYHRE
ncbi:adenylate kinase/UMP-CMP kinase [Kipferlia bialata]|uniref:Adenylate kinase/UMP-CMP kinase n=1 Tax=Kipferlia bialata TaxID=797122 RepID=A0A9K3CRJ2_9EUKA|nr:adenylate kinase/UMP-CMP kinase [Kipferlia bialata]|eukprot:g3043.t1